MCRAAMPHIQEGWSVEHRFPGEWLVPHLSFYAVGPDIRSVIDFIFDQPGWRLVEAASGHDQPLQYFESSTSLAETFDVDWAGGVYRLVVPEAGGGVVERWSELRLRDHPEANGWTHAEGWGLIQLGFGGVRDGAIRVSETNHNTETRARAHELAYPHLGPVSAWNWDEVTRASRRLNHHISRVATDRSESRRILPAAAALRARGIRLDVDLR